MRKRPTFDLILQCDGKSCLGSRFATGRARTGALPQAGKQGAEPGRSRVIRFGTRSPCRRLRNGSPRRLPAGSIWPRLPRRAWQRKKAWTIRTSCVGSTGEAGSSTLHRVAGARRQRVAGRRFVLRRCCNILQRHGAAAPCPRHQPHKRASSYHSRPTQRRSTLT